MTVMVTRAGLLLSVPSLAIQTNSSVPMKPASGVYVNDPSDCSTQLAVASVGDQDRRLTNRRRHHC